jgi:hypothetical protein
MAQPYLEYVTIEVSKGAGDEVAAAGTDGNSFTSAERVRGINRARKEIYTEMLKLLGIDGFKKLYPEFIKISSSIAKTVVAESGCLIPLNAGNSYSAGIITAAVINGSAGIVDFGDADFSNALVLMVDIEDNCALHATHVDAVLTDTTLRIKDLFPAPLITSGFLSAIIKIDADGYFIRPSNCKKVLNVWTMPGEQNVPELGAELYGESIGDAYSSFAGSAAAPKFVEMDEGVRLLPNSLSSLVRFNMLIQPVDVVLATGDDIQEPESWKEIIIQKATEILLSGVQLI